MKTVFRVLAITILFLVIPLSVLSLSGCEKDPGSKGFAQSIKYVRDKHGIVYAVGYGFVRSDGIPNTNTFVMTVIPAAEAEKIPKEEITNLSDFKEK